MYEADQRMKVALFRYGVIAPLVCRQLKPEEAKHVRAEILTQLHEYPDNSVRRVPERTLRHWVRRYLRAGFRGLFDEFRSDRGKSKAISKELMEKAEELRREEPARSVSRIIDLLKSGGHDVSTLKERTVARQLLMAGATKKLLKKGAGSYRRWQQEYVNDMWHGDTAHGIWLRDPEDPSKPKKTKFIVFIDDASRVCTHGEFYFDEQLPKLIDCFGKALLQRGRPCRLLFDNAFIYHSTAMATMCAELGSEISFCRPRAPQGKGKVERFIKTVQDSFMMEANRAAIEKLEDLNVLFQGWLAKYHEREHSELNGLSPIQRWQRDANRISVVTQEEMRRALMLRSKRKVHINTATVSIDGRDYQATSELAGQEVEVRWNPQSPESVEIWVFGEFVEVAREFQIRSFVEPRNKPIEEELGPGIPFESSKLMMSTYRKGGSATDYSVLGQNELLACSEFVRIFRDALDRVLLQQELDVLGETFNRLAPLRRDVVTRSLERAIQSKGPELHLRFYLEQLDQSLRRRS